MDRKFVFWCLLVGLMSLTPEGDCAELERGELLELERIAAMNQPFRISRNRYITEEESTFYQVYEVPRDPYNNSMFSYGDEYNRYGVEYPQYGYKPYGDSPFDCNSMAYNEYTRYVANFKGEWYSTREEESYEVGREENGDELREGWQRYDAEYDEYRPPLQYDEFTPVPSVKPKHCCYHFNKKQLPKRKACDKDKCKRDRKRKEYRQLSDNQRQSLHDAMQKMKDSGMWNVFASYHRSNTSPYAHMGASFLPWHREYLFRFEQELYRHNYSGPGLPYFDSTLDQTLPEPADSAIWTHDYLGNLNGLVTSGPFAGWDSTTNPQCLAINSKLYRNGITGGWGQCFLISDFDVGYVFSKRCFRDITTATDDKFETDHAGVHVFVGGHMGNTECAPNDPVFYLHHAFIDCIWEEFRQNHQQSKIVNEYPSTVNGDNIGNPPFPFSTLGFEWNAVMQPFTDVWNGHGISKWYTKYYKCKPRPVSCQTDSDCGGDLLWCDNGRCKGKIKTGGNCSNLPDNACSNHECTAGVGAICNFGTCQCN